MRPPLKFLSNIGQFSSSLAFAALLALGAPNAVQAEDEDPLSLGDMSSTVDFKRLGGVDGRIQPHGNDLMGDLIDINSGALQFEHTDVSLPGNSKLEVAIRRNIKQGYKSHIPQQHIFGDWFIDLPMAYFKYTTQGGHRAPTLSGGCVTNWGDVNRDFWYSGALGTTMLVPAGTVSEGGVLSIPGKGTSGRPGGLGNFSDPRSEFKYGGQTTDFAGRCAKYVIGPDGTKYKFGRHVIKSAAGLEVPVRRISGGELSRVVYSEVTINRSFAIFLITEVEDVHGNWVRYDYSNDSHAQLTRIYSNDAREINLNYQTSVSGKPRVSSITADDETWGYQYFPQTDRLKKVVLPDTRFWEFGDKSNNLGMFGIQQTPHKYWNCLPYEQTLVVWHPDGARGEFKLRETRHIRGVVNTEVWGEDDWLVYMKPMNIPEPTQSCTSVGGSDAPHRRPDGWPVYQAISLVSKKITGSRIPSAEWTYDYRNYNGGPLDFNWTKVTDPVGTEKTYRYTAIGKGYGLLKELDVSSPLGGSESFRYEYDLNAAFGDGSPSSCWMNSANDYGDGAGVCQAFTERPITRVRHTRDGHTYSTSYSYRKNSENRLLDYGAPQQVNKSSTLLPDYSHVRRTEYEYWHNTANNILGKVSRVTRNDKVFQEMFYNNIGLVEREDRFGVMSAEFGYHSDGNFSWEKIYTNLSLGANGLSRAWYYENYYRGIPREVTRPDNKTLGRSVDYFGRTTSETDARGYTTSYEYDNVGRIKRITPPAGWNPITFEYWGFGYGMWQSKTQGPLYEVNLYDQMMRPILSYTETGNSSDDIQNVTQYDALGRVVFQSYTLNVEDDTGRGIITEYDGLGRVVETRENVAPFATTSTEYLSGNRVQVTDPMGNVTITSRSGYGSPDDGDPMDIAAPEGVNTQLRYDIYGNILTARQYGTQNGYSVDQTQRWKYDDRMRLCRHHTPETQSKLMQYNDANELVAYSEGEPYGSGECDEDLQGIVNEPVTITYDDMGQTDWIVYSWADFDLVNHYYDANGNLTSAARSTGATWKYEYDNQNNIKEEKLEIDGHTWTAQYNYNANGALSSQRYPNGLNVNYSPNSLGQPTEAVSGMNYYADNIEYYPNGVIRRYNYGLSQTFSRELNDRFLPSNITYSGLFGQNYQYDAARRITSIDNIQDNRYDLSLEYDGLNRLQQATGNWGVANFTYDALGNLRKKRLGNRTVESWFKSNNRLDYFRDTREGDVKQRFSHDSKGNVLRNGSTVHGAISFDYDNANQPVGMTGSSVNATHVYDANKKRVKQTINDKTTYSFYNLAGQLLYRWDTAAAKSQVYISVAGQSVARQDHIGRIDYIATDHLGTNIAALDAMGNVKWKELSTPFGEKHIRAAANDNQPFYTGHVEDTETGLTYMQARYYDPVVGRFLSNDPVGFMGHIAEISGLNGFNRYAYAYNNPYGFSDPDGESPVGHHYFPKEIWKKTGLIPNTAEAFTEFNQTTSGPYKEGRHGWSKPHAEYNKGVAELWSKWSVKNKIDPKKMTAKQAHDFLGAIANSKDSRIKGYLKEVEKATGSSLKNKLTQRRAALRARKGGNLKWLKSIAPATGLIYEASRPSADVHCEMTNNRSSAC